MNQPPPPPGPLPSDPVTNTKNRQWWDKARFLLPLAFFLTPIGVPLVWLGKRFSQNAKIVITALAGLIFLSSQCRNSGDYAVAPPLARVDYLIPHTVLRNASTTKKGQWQVEVDLVDGRLPTTEELEFLAKSLANKAGGYDAFERFFFEFYFPGMATKNGGSRTAYALVKLDPNEKSPSLVRTFADNSHNWPDRYQSLTVPKGNW